MKKIENAKVFANKINKQLKKRDMKALNYLNEIINNGSAFVPAAMSATIVNAASIMGIAICSGSYDLETDTRVLYVF